MKKIVCALAITVWASLFFVNNTFAEIPKLLNFQGRLADSQGMPLDGTYSMSFSIYDVDTGGTALWSETQSVYVSEGIYNCILGSQTPLNIPFDKPYYLEVSVAGEKLLPRQSISSVAYALNADRLGGLDVSNFFRQNAGGRIGVGTTSPKATLDVQNKSYRQMHLQNSNCSQELWLGSVWDSIGSYIGNNAYYSTSYKFMPNYTSASGINFRQNGSTEFWNDTGLTKGTAYIPTKRMVILNNGNVGIGTSAPGNYKLYVNGSLYCKGFTNAASSLTLKKDIMPLGQIDYENILSKIDTTQIVRYRLKEEASKDKYHIGPISEYAPEEIVSEDRKGINYSDYLGFLFAAIKAQQEEINGLKDKIAELESRR